jgi:hypothetical protein
MSQLSWTERTDKRGLDPLGLQNAGVALYQSLLPGISNVTLRVRYYGFYCWVSDMYARDGASNDYNAWKVRIRRAEATYALIASCAGGETGVGGIDWANNRLAEGDEFIDFSAATSGESGVRQYLAQPLGVFGGAYYSQMFELGLFVPGEFGVQRTHNVLGLELAEAFRQSIGPEVEALLHSTIKSAVVTRGDLERLAPVAPSAIPANSEERSAYEGLLFARIVELDKDLSRAGSLRLILTAARQVGARPTSDDIRWHLFSTRFSKGGVLEGQRIRWEAYQCHDIFQVAAAALLEWSTTLMDDSTGGSPLGQIQAEAKVRIDELAGDQSSLSWANLRSETDPEAFDFGGSWTKLAGRRGSVEEKAWVAAQVMAAVDARIASDDELNAVVRRELAVKGNARSVVTEIDWLSKHEGERVSDVVAAYLVDRVVRRHSWVAMQKLRRQRDYTFLFELRDGRFVRRNGYAPAPTTPRLDPSVQFLEDIGLVGIDGLTDAGRDVLGNAA